MNRQQTENKKLRGTPMTKEQTDKFGTLYREYQRLAEWIYDTCEFTSDDETEAVRRLAWLNYFSLFEDSVDLTALEVRKTSCKQVSKMLTKAYLRPPEANEFIERHGIREENCHIYIVNDTKHACFICLKCDNLGTDTKMTTENAVTFCDRNKAVGFDQIYMDFEANIMPTLSPEETDAFYEAMLHCAAEFSPEELDVKDENVKNMMKLMHIYAAIAW